MMRLLARDHGLVINVLMFTAHAQRINDFFAAIAPDEQVRVISMDPTNSRTAFEIRACLERGEFVGILGDRVAPGERRGRTAIVPFLGRPAEFSLRPFLLATTLGAPLLFAVCVRTEAAKYTAHVERLFDGERVPRATRESVAAGLLQAYADALGSWCRRAPLQWFNFYAYWRDEPAAQAADPVEALN